MSYDGALDPLGQSQIVPYLLGLARVGVLLTLISFEKPERWLDGAARGALERTLAAAGIRWRPLRYHKRPRLLAKLLDVLAGARAVRSESRKLQAEIVHCRGDIAAVLARASQLPSHVRLLYDVRGFFSGERVDGGSWRAGSWLDLVVRKMEADNLSRADGVVVLTKAAAADLETLRRLPPYRVIPTCADLDRYCPAPKGAATDYSLVYSGSLGTWYQVDKMVAFAKVASTVILGRVLFLTPQPEEAQAAGASPEWSDVRTATPAEVPGWMQRCRAAFFFYKPGLSRRATCPTKMAEALAVGLPVVANTGIGDLDSFIEQERVGVIVRDYSSDSFLRAAESLRALLADPDTGRRCRVLAEQRFGVDEGVLSYGGLYKEMKELRP